MRLAVRLGLTRLQAVGEKLRHLLMGFEQALDDLLLRRLGEKIKHVRAEFSVPEAASL